MTSEKWLDRQVSVISPEGTSLYLLSPFTSLSITCLRNTVNFHIKANSQISNISHMDKDRPITNKGESKNIEKGITCSLMVHMVNSVQQHSHVIPICC